MRKKAPLFPRGVCPTCRQSISGMPLTIDIQNNLIIYDDVVVHMQAKQIEILQILHDAIPNIISTERIYTLVWGAFCENESSEVQQVGLQICLANKILSLLGIKIENVHGRGYRLSLSLQNDAIIHRRRAA